MRVYVPNTRNVPRSVGMRYDGVRRNSLPGMRATRSPFRPPSDTSPESKYLARAKSPENVTSKLRTGRTVVSNSRPVDCDDEGNVVLAPVTENTCDCEFLRRLV